MPSKKSIWLEFRCNAPMQTRVPCVIQQDSITIRCIDKSSLSGLFAIQVIIVRNLRVILTMKTGYQPSIIPFTPAMSGATISSSQRTAASVRWTAMLPRALHAWYGRLGTVHNLLAWCCSQDALITVMSKYWMGLVNTQKWSEWWDIRQGSTPFWQPSCQFLS